MSDRRVICVQDLCQQIVGGQPNGALLAVSFANEIGSAAAVFIIEGYLSDTDDL